LILPRSCGEPAQRDFKLAGRLALLVALASLIAAAFCWPAWPGFMSYDSFLAYAEALHGITLANLPPMHVYLFDIFRPLGVGGVFYFQNFLIFASASAIFASLLSRTRSATIALVAFTGLFLYFPTLLGTVIVIWKDGAMAGFSLLGIAVWLAARRYHSYPWLAVSIMAFGVAIALRYCCPCCFLSACGPSKRATSSGHAFIP